MSPKPTKQKWGSFRVGHRAQESPPFGLQCLALLAAELFTASNGGGILTWEPMRTIADEIMEKAQGEFAERRSEVEKFILWFQEANLDEQINQTKKNNLDLLAL